MLRAPKLSVVSLDSPNWLFWVKRTFDISGSLALLPILLPILGFLALVVWLDSPGQILFVDHRLGRSGRPFRCYKFRTMHVGSDKILQTYLDEHPEAHREWQVYRKLRGHDPRVTRVGKYLRKLSLDELPQIFNVLSGEMSLVGPRPYMVAEKPAMGSYADLILLVRPGITGLWQVTGRNEISFRDRLRLEASYVEDWSLWRDLGLLAKTVVVLLTTRGAS